MDANFKGKLMYGLKVQMENVNNALLAANLSQQVKLWI